MRKRSDSSRTSCPDHLSASCKPVVKPSKFGSLCRCVNGSTVAKCASSWTTRGIELVKISLTLRSHQHTSVGKDVLPFARSLALGDAAYRVSDARSGNSLVQHVARLLCSAGRAHHADYVRRACRTSTVLLPVSHDARPAARRVPSGTISLHLSVA
jgi:hypothetical protein